MKYVLTLALTLLISLPSWAASNPGLDFLNYLSSKYPGKVVGVSGLNANCRIDYSNSATAGDIAAIEAEKQNFDFTPKPDPDPAGFKKALNDDPNIPDLVKVQLTPYLVLADGYSSDPAGTKAAWARVKAVLKIDTAVTDGIEQYAAAFGMPLI